MPAFPHTMPALLASLLAADGTRPLVTYYDDATGERVELSVASFDNAVAKTANLLQDELGADPGERVCLLLPTHWQCAVWVFAVAACGGRLVDDATAADIVVSGPETLDAAVAAGARDVVAMALRPLGGAFTDPLPAGVLDHGVEVAGQPDVFVPSASVAGDTPLLDRLAQASVLDRAVRGADDIALPTGGRLLTDLSPADPDGLVRGTLAALVRGGSVVLMRNPDPSSTARRQEQERITATVWSACG